jgi:hypothetical protein
MLDLCFAGAGRAQTKTPEWMRNVPPARPMAPLGDFPRWPSGPGHYSLMDALTDTRRENPPRYPYRAYGLSPPSMFDVDFRYLDDPANTQHDRFDPLHRIRLGEDWLLATGGQIWWRHQEEMSSRLTGTNNTFDLLRTTVYGDVWYRDRLRAFVQPYDARVFDPELPEGPLDADRHDIQNLFLDLKLGEMQQKSVYLRVGRQELSYGSQRLISTLDWANVRRTFQGVKVFRTGEKVDVDAFWVQPVNFLDAHASSAERSRMNRNDPKQNLLGLWSTYRPRRNHYIDGYYLMLDNDNDHTALGIERLPFTVHTIGSRYYGDYERFLWDVEAMLQVGEQDGTTLVAGSSSVGVGYHLPNLPMNPTLWAYYDFASGDQSPGSGRYSTFNQLFPFGHFYQGWSDVIGRQNVHGIGLYLGFWPTKWIVARLQVHHLLLASTRDALYSILGTPYRRDPTGDAGRHVGEDVALVVNFHVDAHSDILVGYARLFPGRFVRRTGSDDAVGSFYLVYNFRF